MNPATIIFTLFLAVVALGLLLRLVLGAEIRVGGILLPVWVSVTACAVPTGLAVALWRENREA